MKLRKKWLNTNFVVVEVMQKKKIKQPFQKLLRQFSNSVKICNFTLI